MSPRKRQEPRPGREEYNMALAVEVASRSNCVKTHVGTIFLYDGRIRTTGYNGTVEGYKDCFKGGCPRCNDMKVKRAEKLDHCICVHAEENALISAARYGIEMDGSECYVTHEPCLSCTKLLIQAHIKKVVFLMNYEHPGVDQNKNREQMRQSSKRRGSTVFQRFDQVMTDTKRARRLAQSWGDRLARMKEAALNYAKRR
jgi:dCMP deaminase